MTDEANNLILTQLRAIRGDISEVKVRITNLEQGQAAILQTIAHIASTLAQIQTSIDRHGERLNRIEQRLGLVDHAE